MANFGVPGVEEYQYSLPSCPFCDIDNPLLARLKPPTGGVRIISVDGGGTRGVIPLEFLQLLQKVLGNGCNLRDFFDLAIGTSSGELHTNVDTRFL